MRPPKSITCLALVLVLGQTTGCYSYRPARVDPSPINPAGLSPGKSYLFTLGDLSTKHLIFDRSDSLTIEVRETRKGDPRPLKQSDIVSVEESRLDKRNTVLFTAALVVLLGVYAGGFEFNPKLGAGG